MNKDELKNESFFNPPKPPPLAVYYFWNPLVGGCDAVPRYVAVQPRGFLIYEKLRKSEKKFPNNFQ